MLIAGKLLCLLGGGAVASWWAERRRRKRAAGDAAPGGGAPRPPAAESPDTPPPADAIDWKQRLAGYSAEEGEIDRRLAISGAACALATAGAWVAPPLTLLALPFLGASLLPIVRSGLGALARRERMAVAVLDFTSATIVVTVGHFAIISFGVMVYHASRKLLVMTEDHSLRAFADVFGERPQTVWRIGDGALVEIPLESAAVGDVVVVRAGQTIAVDGVVQQGLARIDQRCLTGESQPIDRAAGDEVLAMTQVVEGEIHIRITRAGQATIADQIAHMIRTTDDYKSSVLSRGERIIDRGAPFALGLSALMLVTRGPVGALAMICCAPGYQMRIGAPLSMINYLRAASGRGALVKDGRSLEELGAVDAVVFDKTGTLTEDRPTVAALRPAEGVDRDALLAWVAAAEHGQSHPIARAILAYAEQRGLPIDAPDHVAYDAGLGLRVRLGDDRIQVGSARLMQRLDVALPDDIRRAERDDAAGSTFVFVARNGRYAGAIELAPTIRPEARAVIADLRARGKALYIVSGDRAGPTRHLADALGIERVHAEQLPADKARIIEALRAQGQRTCFVGDGVNDAMALKVANVSISMSGASTAAVDSASIVLMDSDLTQLPALFDLADDMRGNLRRGELMTVAPGIAVAGGVAFLHWGIAAGVLMYNAALLVSVANGLAPLAVGAGTPDRDALDDRAARG